MVTVEKQSGIELGTVQTDNNGNFTYANSTFYSTNALINRFNLYTIHKKYLPYNYWIS